jgi:mRNA-degrading endonuclease YafQ of YafQ-DinJ toxin-antitoxin module
LPDTIKHIAEKREVAFRNNPFHPQLKTHKLHGELDGFLAFSLNFKYRIIFDFVDNETVRFYSVGDHDIYE